MHIATILLCVLLEIASNARVNSDDLAGHGTINVALGNENGIVVLTDSQITLSNGQLSPIPAQKLFKLDDRTVCSFAGFAFASGTGNFFYTRTSAIIKEFARQLAASSQPLSLREKVQALSYLLSRQLTVLATLRQVEGFTDDIYFLQLTVTGYDLDGRPKIAQVELKNTLSMPHVDGARDNFNWEIPQEVQIVEVGKPLVKKLAGIRKVADALLETSTELNREPIIHKYVDSESKDEGASLTVEDMKGLAEELALQTHLKFPGVGGPINWRCSRMVTSPVSSRVTIHRSPSLFSSSYSLVTVFTIGIKPNHSVVNRNSPAYLRMTVLSAFT